MNSTSRYAIETSHGRPRVTFLDSGRLKSRLAIDKTWRALRLVLKWAAGAEPSETSSAEPIEEPAPEKPKARANKDDAPASEPAPVAKKARKRKGAIVLEVSQPEAEAAADVAEAMIAATNPETVA